MFNKKKIHSAKLGEIIKNARLEKGFSARELAKMCDISHTEIINIEKGNRIRPSLLTLKGFEKYLELDFEELAILVGYSEETAKYSDEELIVSYEKFNKRISEYEIEKKELLYKIDSNRHIGFDIKNYYDDVYKEILKNETFFTENTLKKAKSILPLLDNLIKEYKPIHTTDNIEK